MELEHINELQLVRTPQSSGMDITFHFNNLEISPCIIDMMVEYYNSDTFYSYENEEPQTGIFKYD